MENYYELLEVSKNASDEVISKVFKHHIKKNHPDLFTGKAKVEAELKVKKLNEAYDILSNPEKRKEYDEILLEEEYKENNNINDEIEQLVNENKGLKHNIDNYNRFIYEYFYEKANEVFDIIKSYDLEEGYNINTLGVKGKAKKFLIKIAVYLIAICILFLIISILFNVNVFSILFDVLFN